MARGNWRSGEGHGPAEVGSYRRTFDGWVMKVDSRHERESDVISRSLFLQSIGYKTNVVKGRKYWIVYRTLRIGQKRME